MRSIPGAVQSQSRRLFVDQVPQDLRRVSRDNRVFGHVLRDRASRPDDGVFPNRQPGQDGGAGTNGGSSPDYRTFHLPVGVGLQFACGTGGARVAVVDEGHPVPDEDVVLDDYALTDKGMTGYLATFPD